MRAAILYFAPSAMALLFGSSPFVAILLDGDDEGGSPLPSWAMRGELRPPTMSMERPVDIFDKLAERGMCFEFANCGNAYKPAACFCCSICMQFLEEPAACMGCQQAMCTRCWERAREISSPGEYRCPLCRHVQPSIEVSRCMQQVLDHELRSKGISFSCNTCSPGSRPDALWCCQATFDSLKELRQHLSLASPFRTTRTQLRRLLALAASGSKESRERLFDDPMQRQKLALVLEEDQIVETVARRRLLAQTAVRHRSKSRSPRASDRP